MTRRRYSMRESLNRLLRLFEGESFNDAPETLPGEILSENQALSDMAELFNSSLPGQIFVLPDALTDAIVSAGFATGTVSNYSVSAVTGTTTILTEIETFVFGSSLSVAVTGTTLYLDVA